MWSLRSETSLGEKSYRHPTNYRLLAADPRILSLSYLPRAIASYGENEKKVKISISGATFGKLWQK